MQASDKPLNVFVSSTWLDLGPERDAVRDLTLRMLGLHFLGMEHFGARDEDTLHVSLAEAERADLYVGVIGARWGSGITALEYERARAAGKPCFIYFKRRVPGMPTDPDTSAQARLVDFAQRLRGAHTCVEFDGAPDLASKLAADLHNWLFEQHLARGLARLSNEFLARVHRFVAEYVGTPAHSVPFGGRERELAELDDWLADPSAPSYLLVAAGAGRGKSALLVRWVQSLIGEIGLAPLFFPVSIRFRTNLASVIFASLTAYLNALHGEQLSVNPDTPPEVWRGRLAELLQRPLPDGRRLLLVLDGLDEAADWEIGPDLFPLELGGHARVVVSARLLAGDRGAGDWLRRLGWNAPRSARVLDLGGITEAGLADVLLRQGGARLAAMQAQGMTSELVHELHRLSEGDPLLVRLYIEHLVTPAADGMALRATALRSIEPGLAGFFKNWWDDQHRLWGSARPLEHKRVQAVMDLLANALGPLSRDDLLGLAPAAAELGGRSIDGALEPLRRFVVGDGVDSGYVFSHPRLAIHFREDLGRKEVAELEERFIVWCEQAVAQAQGPVGAVMSLSPYVVQYFGAHLDRQGAPAERYRPMLDDLWRCAWPALEGATAGYRGDLHRVQRVLDRDSGARPEDPVLQSLTARCALCAASVDEVARSTPVELVAPLVRAGLWGRIGALRYARSITDPLQRARGLFELARVEGESNVARVQEEAIEALAATVAEVQGEDDPEHRCAELLAAWAMQLDIGAVAPALLLACGLSHRGCMARAVDALLPRLTAGQVDRVFELVETLTDDDLRMQLHLRAAATHPGVALARAAGAGLSSWERCWLLLGASDGLGSSARIQALASARDELDSLLGISQAPGGPAELMLALAWARRCDDAERTAALLRWAEVILALPPHGGRTQLLCGLASLVPASAHERVTTAALSGLALLKSPSLRALRLVELAPALTEAESRRALALAQAIDDGAAQVSALAALLPRLEHPLRDQVLAQLLTLDEPLLRIEALLTIAGQLPQGECDRLALEACVHGVRSTQWQYESLARLAPHLSGETMRLLLDDEREDQQVALARAAALVRHLPINLRAQGAGAVRRALDRFYSPYEDLSHEYIERWVEIDPGVIRQWLDQGRWRHHIAHSAKGRAILRTLAPHMVRDSLADVLRELQTIGDREVCSSLIAACLARLDRAAVRPGLDFAWRQLWPDDRARTLVRWWVRGDDRGDSARAETVAALAAMSGDGAATEAIGEFVEHAGERSSPLDLAPLVSRLARVPAGGGARVLRRLVAGVDDETLAAHFEALFVATLAADDAAMAVALGLAMRVDAAVFGRAFAAECRRLAPLVARGNAESPLSPGLMALVDVACRVDAPRAARTRWPLLRLAARAQDGYRADLIRDVARSVLDGSHPALHLASCGLDRLNETWSKVCCGALLLQRLDEPACSVLLLACHNWIDQVPSDQRYAMPVEEPAARLALSAGAWKTALWLATTKTHGTRPIAPLPEAAIEELHETEMGPFLAEALSQHAHFSPDARERAGFDSAMSRTRSMAQLEAWRVVEQDWSSTNSWAPDRSAASDEPDHDADSSQQGDDPGAWPCPTTWPSSGALFAAAAFSRAELMSLLLPPIRDHVVAPEVAASVAEAVANVQHWWP